MALFRRIRDYAREYQQRQEKARREGYRSYGAKRYAQEAPKREAKRREREVRQPAPRPRRRESKREQLEREAVNNYRRQFGTSARISTVRKGLRWLSIEELRDAGSASRQRLRYLASLEPRFIREGKEVNPYWYH